MSRPRKLDLEKCFDNSLKAVRDLVPPEKIREVARETKFIKRGRKVCPVFFFWNLVLGFGCSAQRTLAALKRQYEVIAAEEIVPSAFYDRFSGELVEFLKKIFSWMLESAVFPKALKGRLAELVSDVKIFDSTIIKLFEGLKKEFPGVSSPAAAKVSVIMSLSSHTAETVTIHAGKKADLKTIRLGPWVKNNLLLFDLGYFKFGFFARIMQLGGHFISRLRSDANPKIIAIHKTHRGRAIPLVGKTIKEVRDLLRREEIDVEVELEFEKRSYRGKPGKHEQLVLRLVGQRNQETESYHFYLTDLPPESLSVSEVAALYRGRWFIELLFKELKSKYALDRIGTSNKNIVHALIYTALITLTTSRVMYHAYQAEVALSRKTVKPLRWATIFKERSSGVLYGILRASGFDDLTITRMLKLTFAESIDPTPGRWQLEEVFSL